MFQGQAAVPARTCLVIPCYNEAARLDMHAFRDYLASHSPVRFLFVDDGSTDNTAGVLRELCYGFEDRAAYLCCKPNRGKAETVRTGILHALENYPLDSVGFWDADLATPLSAIAGFAGVLARRMNIEMVFGSRVQLLGRFVKRSPARHYLGRVFATAASLTLRLPIYDTQCGAKLFRVTPNLHKLFAEPFLSKWVFDVEIIARYSQLCNYDRLRLQTSIYEFALERWSDVAGSKVRPSDFFVAISDLAKIKRTYRLWSSPDRHANCG